MQLNGNGKTTYKSPPPVQTTGATSKDRFVAHSPLNLITLFSLHCMEVIMKYVFVFIIFFSLYGCAVSSSLIGVNRSTGERITIQSDPLHFGYDELTTIIEGESFVGKLVGTDDSTVLINGQMYEVSGKKARAVLLGNKGHTVRCDISGGVGTCITSAGEIYDITW